MTERTELLFAEYVYVVPTISMYLVKKSLPISEEQNNVLFKKQQQHFFPFHARKGPGKKAHATQVSFCHNPI